MRPQPETRTLLPPPLFQTSSLSFCPFFFPFIFLFLFLGVLFFPSSIVDPHSSSFNSRHPQTPPSQTLDPTQLRSRACDTLYDVFVNIRDDELEHVATMVELQAMRRDEDLPEKRIWETNVAAGKALEAGVGASVVAGSRTEEKEREKEKEKVEA